MRLDLLLDQEARLQPKIEAAQKRLKSLAQTDPLVIALAESNGIRNSWENLSLENKRKVISALVTPSLRKANKDEIGRRGLHPNRVILNWH